MCCGTELLPLEKHGWRFSHCPSHHFREFSTKNAEIVCTECTAIKQLNLSSERVMKPGDKDIQEANDVGNGMKLVSARHNSFSSGKV